MRIYKTYFLFLSILFLSCNKNISKIDDKKVEELIGDVVSCGNAQVYQLLDDSSYLSIRLNANKLRLSNKMQFDLSENPENIIVTYEKYNGTIKQSLCNDVIISRPKQILRELSLSGKLAIEIADVELSKYHRGLRYSIDIYLENLEFQSKKIKHIRISAAQVGWMPG